MWHLIQINQLIFGRGALCFKLFYDVPAVNLAQSWLKTLSPGRIVIYIDIPQSAQEKIDYER